MNQWIQRLARSVGGGLGGMWHEAAQARQRSAGFGTRRAYRCQCDRPVYFHNDRCLGCETALGFDPQRETLLALKPVAGTALFEAINRPLFDAGQLAWGEARNSAALFQTSDQATSHSAVALLRRCANHASAACCNWLLPAEAASPWCASCRLNRTVPDLDVAGNGERWRRIEAAKRRLVSQLLALGLPVRSRLDEDRQGGLMFDFLAQLPGAPRIVTGHAQGLITLDVAEADDAHREAMRTALREPYRTLLGHLRHEAGHYYWDRLVRDGPWYAPFRSVFGDERQNYALALQQHYRIGAPAGWEQRHVTAYASAHPWEDWAETWAHYLHMADTLDTAQSYGLDASDVQVADVPTFAPADLWRAHVADADVFLAFVNNWMALTRVLNELSRGMGQPDFYPFVLPRAALPKLQLVHMVIQAAGARPGR